MSHSEMNKEKLLETLTEALEALEKAADANGRIYRHAKSTNIKTIIQETDEWYYPAMERVRQAIASLNEER